MLNNDTKQYGKKFMFDGSEETCWNSDQGAPQSITVDFGRVVAVRELRVMFQGGFVGKVCQVLGCGAGVATFEALCQVYPEDNNALQTFAISATAAAGDASGAPQGGARVERVKLVFPESTDFYGRVTVYTLSLYGEECDEA